MWALRYVGDELISSAKTYLRYCEAVDAKFLRHGIRTFWS